MHHSVLWYDFFLCLRTPFPVYRISFSCFRTAYPDLKHPNHFMGTKCTYISKNTYYSVSGGIQIQLVTRGAANQDMLLYRKSRHVTKRDVLLLMTLRYF